MAQRDAERGSSVLEAAAVVHFVGIGGIGMSALAELLVARGKKVTGSDVKDSPVVERLRSMGVRVNVGHAAGAVEGASLVVATSAAKPDNPELAEALHRGIPMMKRAELLGWLMSDSYGIAVSGTHGKTTTTGMVAFLLHRAGMDPTVLVGGEPLDFESHGLPGRGRYLVAEADEFDRSFLQLWPKVAVITSVEADHLDCYADLDDIARTFAEFASRVPADGLLVTCADDPVLQRMVVQVPRTDYGFDPGAQWHLESCSPAPPFGTQFVFTTPARASYACRLQLPGRHYALNALGAVAAAGHVGIDPSWAAEALAGFRGTRRRYELVGEAAGLTVIDDYAHHPTAVRETLRAARERHTGEIWCVFQPHTSNRTEKLLEEFSTAFAAADHVLMLPVYHPAGREEESMVGSRDLVARMRHPDARCVDGLVEAATVLEAEAAPGALVLTMGAGDVNRVGSDLLSRLRNRPSGTVWSPKP